MKQKMPSIDKTKLAKMVAKRCGKGVTIAQAEKVLNVLFGSRSEQSIIIDLTCAGNKVALYGFGGFYAVPRSARTVPNPFTGEPIHVAATRSPKFSAGNAFKRTIRLTNPSEE